MNELKKRRQSAAASAVTQEVPIRNRRHFLKLTGASALAAAARMAFPAGAFAQGAGPEVKGAKLGYIALTDSSPLIIAKEKGLFAKYGLPDVEVLKQASWGALRDNIVLGGAANGIDGAHILRPMVHLISTGKVTQNNVPTALHILLNLNLDAQAISISGEYADLKIGTDAGKLKEAFAKKKASGKDLTAAMTFPGGTHDLWIRYWLAAGGIDPDSDIKVIVVPPPQMVANMKVGNMDLFCVGEPWNEQLVNQNIGYTAVATGEIWPKHPEKVLGVRAEWTAKNPRATEALTAAVIEAQIWADKMENKAELAEIVGRRQWFNVPPADIIGRLTGKFNYGSGKIVENSPQFMKFWRDNASYPFKSHDTWFITENIRWGKFEQNTDIKAIVDKTNREDVWRAAAKLAGVPASEIPTTTSRGTEKFFDGVVFDPEKPEDYLKSLKIKRGVG
jgi:nitrate/nitrite transport system substrate-binding protein